ncbi:unnamed protein product [Hymenolepis diminuta]|uniref:C3H1-type domain-containing protein n=1 Tax=Hymenolepis diminuta TaxID=6216 RepID=A0A564YSB9_HYMDI|nr:unnamed protein product [Hymenolepis diminuta]
MIGLNAFNFLPGEIRHIPRVTDKIKSILFKTKLSTRFMSGVLCFRGDSCSFAHGFGKLREVSQHPSY